MLPLCVLLFSNCSPSCVYRLWWRPGRMALWEALSSLLFRSLWWHRVLGLPRVQTDLWLSGWHGFAGWRVCGQGGVSLQIPQQLCYWLDPQSVCVNIANGSGFIVWVNCVGLSRDWSHQQIFFSDIEITSSMPDSSNASWVGPGGTDWQFANPGDSIMSDCKNWYWIALRFDSCNKFDLYMYNWIHLYVQKNSILLFSFILLFCHLSHYISVHVRLGFCSVNLSLVAMLMVAGANGGSGLSVHFLVEEESSSGDASVITHPLRVVGEAVWESLNSRKTATHTCAQVVLSDQPSLNLKRWEK